MRGCHRHFVLAAVLAVLASMHGRRSLAVLTMSLSLTLLVIIPLASVACNLTDDVAAAA